MLTDLNRCIFVFVFIAKNSTEGWNAYTLSFSIVIYMCYRVAHI